MTDADRYHIPPANSPSVNAAYVLDLKPLIAWFRDMLAEARTAAADAKCEARGHRERVVELEARLAEATKPRIEFDYKAMLDKQRQEWCSLSDNYVQQIKNLEKRAQRAEDKLGKANCERDEALEKLEHARCGAKDAQQMLMDERKRVQVHRVELTPGSTAAVVEAYRLLAGYEPVFGVNGQWADDALPTDTNYDAERALLLWLNASASDGKS
jgi:hypothetical protein